MNPARGLRGGLRRVVPALLLANLLGYVVFVGAGRLLGPADFAVFAAFWGLLFAFGGMTASVEQETARLVAAGTPARDPRLLGAGLVVGAVLSTGLVVTYPGHGGPDSGRFVGLARAGGGGRFRFLHPGRRTGIKPGDR